MGSEFVELSSSDEGEDVKKRKHENDDDDEVTIIDISQCSSFTSSRERKIPKIVVDSDDCCIIEPNPRSKIVEVFQTDLDELVVTGEVGPIACRDFPHARHLCARFTFAETPHESFCDQCHCYVCDKLAPCEAWVSHCHASDKENHWKIMRKSHNKLQFAYKPVPAFSTPSPPPPPYTSFSISPARPPYTVPRPHTTTTNPRTMGDYARGPTGPRTKGKTPILSPPGFARGHLVLRPPNPPPKVYSTPHYNRQAPNPRPAITPRPVHPPVTLNRQVASPVTPRSVTPVPPRPATPVAPRATRYGTATRTSTNTHPATGMYTALTTASPVQAPRTGGGRPKKQARKGGVASSRRPPQTSGSIPSVQIPSVQIPSVQTPSVQIPSVQVPSCSISTAAPLDPSPLRSPTAPIAPIDAITSNSSADYDFFRTLFDNSE